MEKLKNGHSLFRVLFVVILLGALACVLATLLYGDAEITEAELKEMQTKAETAYKTVYFGKVKDGSRGEVEVAELIKQLKEDGVNGFKISNFKFTIENGKVTVEPKHAEVVKD